MRVEEVLKSGFQLQVARVNMSNRRTSTGAHEAVTQVFLHHSRQVPEDFNNPAPYFELSFEISRDQLDQYQPGTQFHLSLTPAK